MKVFINIAILALLSETNAIQINELAEGPHMVDSTTLVQLEEERRHSYDDEDDSIDNSLNE